MESDDDMDYRRRDKFKTERGSGTVRFPGAPHQPGPPGRGYWRGPPPPSPRRGQYNPPAYYAPGENSWRRGQSGPYGPPPYKRPRGEMEMMSEERPSPKKLERNMIASSLMPSAPESSNDGYLPARMTFKAFLSTQDDSITDEEAAFKYTEYKLEFRRQHLNEFFSNHKDSEWFREKYHPIDMKNKKEEIQKRVKKRLEVYQEIDNKGLLDEMHLNSENENKLVKLLNTVVIKLEGGTEKELKVLDDGYEEDEKVQELHKTSSVFLKSLQPKITHAELEAVCKRYPGYMRLSLSDPDPTKKWSRKGWITFERKSKIKEICFNLNNVRIRGKELDPVVNKDLSKKIRSVPYKLGDQKIARNDIRVAAKIITNLDKKQELWTASANPLLRNVHDYLIEEVSAEEEELLKKTVDEGEHESKDEEEHSIELNNEVLTVLDKMTLYLRIVHSTDLYSHTQYQNEDEMPNRLGLLHVRDITADMKDTLISDAEIEKINAEREKKFKFLMEKQNLLEDDEASKLGLKIEEDEVEKFVSSNCQEVNKDKWLCPLSGKKFKAPEFIKKHIFNKFSDQVEKVKQESQFYNNYLRDPARPELPERPQVTKPKPPTPPSPTGHEEQDNEDFTREPSPPRNAGRKRSIHDRLGRPGIRATQTSTDPRQIVDYSDISDIGGPADSLF